MKSTQRSLFLTICFVLAFSFSAYSEDESKRPSLRRVEARRTDNVFLSELVFNQSLKEIPYEIKYINRSIQVDFPKLGLSTQKLHYPIKDDPKVSSLYSYQLKDGSLRLRINLNEDLTAEQYRDLIQITNHDKAIQISLEEPEALKLQPPVAVSGESPQEKVDQALQTTFEKALVESQQASLPQTGTFSKESSNERKELAGALPANKSESETPIHLNAGSKSTPNTPSLRSLAMATIGLVVLMVALLLGFRWWTARSHKTNNNTRIKILAQHYLGPKRSLAIIRVAGESILIGITDQNISLIKPLSLLDEEIPESSPQSFSQSLNSADHDDVDDFAIKEIRNLVTTKLKDLRQI